MNCTFSQNPRTRGKSPTTITIATVGLIDSVTFNYPPTPHPGKSVRIFHGLKFAWKETIKWTRTEHKTRTPLAEVRLLVLVRFVLCVQWQSIWKYF